MTEKRPEEEPEEEPKEKPELPDPVKPVPIKSADRIKVSFIIEKSNKDSNFKRNFSDLMLAFTQELKESNVILDDFGIDFTVKVRRDTIFEFNIQRVDPYVIEKIFDRFFLKLQNLDISTYIERIIFQIDNKTFLLKNTKDILEAMDYSRSIIFYK
jgi:hypothetical protein